MRARLLALLALLLLVSAGVGAARGQSGEPEDPDDGRGDGDDSGPGSCDADEANETSCRAGENRTSRQGRSCDDDDGDRDCRVGAAVKERLDDDWVDFEVRDDASLANYTVAGRLVLEYVDWIDSGELRLDQRHGRLRVMDDNGTLTLHNNPTGLIRFNGTGTFELTFPPNATVTESDNGTTVDVNGTQVKIVFEDGAWDGLVLNVSGFWSLHVPAHGAPAEVREELRSEIEEALSDRRIGAQIKLSRASAAGTSLDEAFDGIEILAFDAVDVDVDLPVGLATAVTPIRIQVGSDLEEGRTIILDVDPELVGHQDPSDLQLAYFDVADDASETEVLFVMATDLADVLDPMDDEGQPEYWVVSDANGLQVLVSVPHWSIHVITIAGIIDTLTQPSVIVGVVAGVAGSVVAAVFMMWPRRREHF